jgi:putative ABC transport system permease protein
MTGIAIAIKMLLEKKSRFVLTNAGIGVAFFLSAAQLGLLIGWCNTCSAIVRNAGVDIWVMAPRTQAFDYGTPIPRLRIFQVRNVPGVEWSEGMIMTWNTWQRRDGKQVNVELVGLDDSDVGGPWAMCQGEVEVVHRPDTVIVDELYFDALGVKGTGDEAELLGHRAVVGGTSLHIRTLTASPFVFTSLRSAIRFDGRYRDEEITYVLVRCAAGQNPEEVCDRIAREVPNVEVLTTQQFARRTMRYWMAETGLGATVGITAILGLVVGAVIISQTLFAITQDNLSHYATLLALGFSRKQLAAIVLFQSLLLGSGGVALGSALFACAARASATTPVPLETTHVLTTGLAAASLACCVLASAMSIRSLFRIDPVRVFRV